MDTTPVLSPDQLNSPAAIADPYPFYRHLRKQSPVSYIHLPGGIFPGIDEPVRAWRLMKYADVYGALRDHDTFSSARNPLIRERILSAAGAHHGRPAAPYPFPPVGQQGVYAEAH